MSTAYTSAKVKFTGNGSATEFGFDFPYKKESEIKVYLKRENTTEDVLTQDVDYSFVSENTIKFPASGSSQTVLTSSDVLAIQRESDFESQYNFTNQQRLEPEEVMNSDDNLERQIQELKRDSDAAVKVPPTSDMTTDDLLDYLEVAYESKDEIKTVAQNMVDVNTVADSITNVDAVSGAIDNVAVVSGKLNEIQTVSDAANSVVLCATEIDSIIDAPNQASAASASASAASASASAASASASAASASASDAAQSAALSKGLPVGAIFFMPWGVDESEGVYRYLNGSLLIQSQYTVLTEKLKSMKLLRADLFTTETNWQAEKTASVLGQCGKFVIDDDAGTIRLPCVVNINGLTDLANCGVVKSESLPNITGNIGVIGGTMGGNSCGGGFANSSFSSGSQSGIGGGLSNSHLVGVTFNASRSSSTYQNNAPVQQEAVQYPYVICVNTGVEEADRPINNYQVNNVYSYGMSQYYKGTMNNNSWLKSNGQWNSGTVYTDVYNWALEQMNAGTSGFVASTAEYTDYDWVINTADQTFRLPLLNGQEGVFANAVKGNGTTIGLLDKYGTHLAFGGQGYVSGTGNGYSYTLAASPEAYGSVVGTAMGNYANSAANTTFGLTDEANKSGMIVDKTVPEGYYLYFYVGDTLQNASLIDIAKLGESVATKVNEVQAAAASMPSSKYIDLTLGATASTYTAPANGWFQFNGYATAPAGVISLIHHNKKLKIQSTAGSGGNQFLRTFLPVERGDIIRAEYYYLDTTKDAEATGLLFIYAEGDK